MAHIKELKRMCKNMTCKDCPLSDGDVNDCWVLQPPDSYPDEDIDAIVDKWVLEHPVKTYMQDFFEKFPNAERNSSKNPIPTTKGTMICRKSLYVDELPCIRDESNCKKCWTQEMKTE